MMKMVSKAILFEVLILSYVGMFTPEAFVTVPVTYKNVHEVSWFMAKEDGDSKQGYRFGDLTRGVLKSVRGGDGKTSDSKGGYKFGDLTRGVLKKANENSSGYKFGDISRWLDKHAKEHVSKFTKKENYKFGDMSKEVVRRLVSGEYSKDDLLLFLKIVATIGINLQPVTSVLPLRVLTELLNMTMEASIAQSVGERVVSTITNEIDGRMKELVTGDRNYEAGDFTKKAVSKWTGKDGYQFGDVTKTIMDKRAAAAQDGQAGNENSSSVLDLFSSNSESNLLEEWDKQLLKNRREQEGLGPLKDDESYRHWDEKFLSSPSAPKP
mmetsp:Transcript_28824/g.78099  ORF Transcript_28824/g.78099 Transcript_28824/m.78099 type:complete len:324 (-) Transcript_28824:252-1223(-)